MRTTLHPVVLLLASMPTMAVAARLDVELTGVDNDRGLVSVCTRETFTTRHCSFVGASPAKAGGVTVHLYGIPAGRYAVQAYHDEDGNGQVRRGLFGLPSDAIGFSRDAPLRLGPPRFDDAVIDIADPATTAKIKLRHVGG